MAAEHPPPPGGGPGPGTTPAERVAVASDPEEAAAAGNPPKRDTAAAVRRPGGGIAGEAGASGSAGRGRRLLPSGPAIEHAPLLLGLDAAGGEHPQGGEYPDDEDLIGRVWGCVCGWRGTVRDVSSRPFHPRVGDGGGLRRQRLARSDRDTRPELEDHLARNTPAPADPPNTVSPAPAPSGAGIPVQADAPQQPGNARPRGRRRRLTVPRDIPLATPADTALPAARYQVDDSEHDVPSDDRATSEATVDHGEAAESEAAPSSLATSALYDSLTNPEPATADHAETGKPSSVDLLEHAVARAEAARVELAAAESALNGAVAAAREDGLSWRTIGRATGLSHRAAAARWGPPGGGPSL